jgi:hypothetical protein
MPFVTDGVWNGAPLHQGAPVLVALAAMAFDVIVGFGLKRFDQHPPRSRPRDFVQQQKLLTRFPIILLLDYLQHRWRPPSNPAPTGVSRCSRGRVRRLFHACIKSTTFGNSSNERREILFA